MDNLIRLSLLGGYGQGGYGRPGYGHQGGILSFVNRS